MRWNRFTALVGVLPLCGCTLVSRAVYNVEYDKTLRADLQERSAEHRRLAEEAWVGVWAAGRDAAPEPGFAEGFVDGFADYLDRGGPGGPPAVPPNPYRFGAALSPEGHRAAGRYADGFAAGAAAARASGLRANSLVPVFLPPAGEPGPDARPAPAAPAPRPEVLPPPGPVGPPPREVGRGGPDRRPRRPAPAVPAGEPSPDDTGVLSPAGP